MFKVANVGSADRIFRIILGLALVASPFLLKLALWENPAAKWAAIVVGLVLIVTAVVRFCPLYRVVGASTCKNPAS
ncbi:MAG: DUF2892 domain-containing protein [Granulosicoccaceae bacterium]